ncbi:MAG: hypothetical protein PVI43_01045 [Candidatus Bathyarchaeota archaeon]|jgi:hypothetical protein
MAVKTPTRNDLARFLPTNELIRAFEDLFRQSGTDTPNLSEEIAIESATATSLANAVFSKMITLKQDSKTNDAVLSSKIESSLALLDHLGKLIDTESKKPPIETTNTPAFNYVDFRQYCKRAERKGRVAWCDTHRTLEVDHGNSIMQQIGLETFIRVNNGNGATLSNGRIIGYDDATTSGAIKGKYYIADGSESSLYVLGIATEDIVSGEDGFVTNFGNVNSLDASGTPYGETWANGDILYVSADTAGYLTNIRPTAPDYVIPVAIVIDNDSSDGVLFARVEPQDNSLYGSFYDLNDHSPAAANTAYAITFSNTQSSNGVYIGSPTSRIYVNESGLYSVSFSAQLTSGSSSAKNVWFWPRINGVDVANSSMVITIISNAETKPLSRNMTFNLNAGDYIEAMWAADDVNVTLDYSAASGFAPASPSAILTVEQIAK